jgi:hypothetical protein
MGAKNPFRNAAMRSAFAGAVGAYDRRSGLLFLPDGVTPYRGNSVAGMFWRGFDGQCVGTWDAASKQTLAYAQWCAGVACANRSR